MLKLATLLASVAFLAGCQPHAEKLDFPVIPDGLKDCQFFKLGQGGLGRDIMVVRCPNSSTSTTYQQSNGKTTSSKTVVNIDGIPLEIPK